MNFGEIIAADFHHRIDGFLACDHHPYFSSALASEFLNDGLEINHQVAIIADVLAYLVHTEQKTEVLALGIDVFFDFLHELLNAHVSVFFTVEPVAGCGFTHTENTLQDGYNVVLKKRIGSPGFYPRCAVDFLKLLVESVGLAAHIHKAFQFRYF
ncbi:MAG: hypothetical protein BWY95_01529 [Bacteroidetes bacterium ADurb.BinA104]|nr:MAG: hypothetical protein BWY95_01529 [Bacteroidetes bacterium ADurb.BinA104]